MITLTPITLPRSGVVLKPDGFSALVAPGGATLFPPSFGVESDWSASFPCGFSDAGNGTHGTLAQCVEWLDAQAIEARDKLLPEGAIVLREDEETVERLAEALYGLSPYWLGKSAPEPWGCVPTQTKEAHRKDARHVLAVLRIEGAKR